MEIRITKNSNKMIKTEIKGKTIGKKEFLARLEMNETDFDSMLEEARKYIGYPLETNFRETIGGLSRSAYCRRLRKQKDQLNDIK